MRFHNKLEKWMREDCGLHPITSIDTIAEASSETLISFESQGRHFLIKISSQTDQHILQWELQSARVFYGFGGPKTALPIRFGLKGDHGYLLYDLPELKNEPPEPDKVAIAFSLQHQTSVPWSFGFNHPSKKINGWSKDWGSFFLEKRLKPLIDQKKKSQKGLEDWYEENYHHIYASFKKENIKPSLLHGNIHPDYIKQTHENEVLALAPKCVYGHAQMEFEALCFHEILDEKARMIYLENVSTSSFNESLTEIYQTYFSLLHDLK